MAEGTTTTSNGDGSLSGRAAGLGSGAAWFGSRAARLRGRAAGLRSGAARLRGKAATTSSIVAIGGIGVVHGGLGEELIGHTDGVQVNVGSLGKELADLGGSLQLLLLNSSELEGAVEGRLELEVGVGNGLVTEVEEGLEETLDKVEEQSGEESQQVLDLGGNGGGNVGSDLLVGHQLDRLDDVVDGSVNLGLGQGRNLGARLSEGDGSEDLVVVGKVLGSLRTVNENDWGMMELTMLTLASTAQQRARRAKIEVTFIETTPVGSGNQQCRPPLYSFPSFV